MTLGEKPDPPPGWPLPWREPHSTPSSLSLASHAGCCLPLVAPLAMQERQFVGGGGPFCSPLPATRYPIITKSFSSSSSCLWRNCACPSRRCLRVVYYALCTRHCHNFYKFSPTTTATTTNTTTLLYFSSPFFSLVFVPSPPTRVL